ncbi:MAG: hypothetical protein ACJ8AI_13910 [Rhodopila sp.]
MDALPDAPAAGDSAPPRAGSDTAKSGKWGWLDRPFTLFILGSVLISLSGFTFNNYNTCRGTFAKDQQQLGRLYREYGRRIGRLKILQSYAAKDPAGVIGPARVALDPNARFVFLDFKGRTLDDIDFETNYLETKWNKEPTPDYARWPAGLTQPIDAA